MSEPRIYTYSGLNLNPLDPQPEQIRIEDIAHALACCNRFAGHVAEPISVAQHSVYAVKICQVGGAPREVQLQALLHDASEAYLGDVTKWLKAAPEMVGYRTAEERVQQRIYARYGCRLQDDPQVKYADNVLVRYEMLKGFKNRTTVGALNPEHDRDYPPLIPEELGYFDGWYPWTWRMAEAKFLETFQALALCEPPPILSGGEDWDEVWRDLGNRYALRELSNL